ncbi:DUF1440 domain-containing protein [Arachidicoccus terrestris]|uniref:DUF1440 domain-containing protein n=1 Tax=Arachidicoccus terrestris TaxID=2875539 RepID=UPI001CC745AD|nr:DUF1440 domain-containing protein [Arachidicoccus terrestris]UAY55409.1 DUF1440 domain-containing protein [Arachidicoccus terrestris]
MNRISSAVLKIGFLAGCADILIAFVDAWWSYDILPVRVLQFIASGLLGEKAFEQPVGPALLGLAIHFFIAFFWTVLFFVLYGQFKKVVGAPFMQGIVYGLFIWLVMNLLVLPLTHAPGSEFRWFTAIKGTIILIIAIGCPLAYFARSYYLKKETDIYKKQLR